MRFLPAVVVIFAFAFTACSDSAGPLEGIEVVITGDVSYAATPGELPGIACAISLTARAAGSSDRAATWQSGMLRLYAGLDRDAPLDSIPLEQDDVRAIMQSFAIVAGQEVHGELHITAPVPFSARGEFDFEHEGSIRPAQVEFDCGPAVEDGLDTPLPTIRIVGTVPRIDRLQPGDIAYVRYEATSPIGLWVTEVVIAGAVNDTLRLVENFSPSVVRMVPIFVPHETPAGLDLEVTLTTYDGVLRPAQANVEFTEIRDIQAPSGDAWLAADRARCAMPRCQYMPDAPLRVGLEVSDNVELAWLVYRLGTGARDSIPLNGREIFDERILEHRGTTGITTVHLWLRDMAGNISPNLLNETINLIPELPGTTRTAMTGHVIRDAVLDVASDRLWILAPERLRAFSLLTLSETVSIPLHGQAVGFDLSPDGSEIVVALLDTMALQRVDVALAAADPVLIPIDLYTDDPDAPTIRLNHVRVDASGDWYVAADDWGQGLLLAVARDGTFTSAAYHWQRFLSLERPALGRDVLVQADECRRLLSRIIADGWRDWRDCASESLRALEPGASGARWASVDSIYDASLTSLYAVTHRDPWIVRMTAPREASSEVFATTDSGLEVVAAADGRVVGALAGPAAGDEIIVGADALVVVLSKDAGRVIVYDWR